MSRHKDMHHPLARISSIEIDEIDNKKSLHKKSSYKLVIGYWLLVIGYWLLVIGYWLLVIGYWLLVIGQRKTGMIDEY